VVLACLGASAAAALAALGWFVWRPSGSQPAELFAEQGSVSVGGRDGTQEITAPGSASVQEGGLIRVPPGSRALLVLSPSSSVLLESGSELQLEGLSISEMRPYTIRLQVSAGETVHRLSGTLPELSQYEVLTPAASVLLLAGQYVISVTDSGDTTVEALEGMAQVSGYDTTVQVAPGEFSSVAPHRAPAVPRAIAARSLYVSERTGNAEIWLLDEDGRELQLTHDRSADLAPVWSPDGKYIAFESWRDGNSEIYLMEGDGSNQRRLTHNRADDYFPAWSPDGRFIAFESLRDGQREIYVMKADGTDPARLTFGPGLSAAPHWEIGGAEILFSRIESDTNGDARVDLRDLSATYSVPEAGGTPYAVWGTKLVFEEMVYPWARRAAS
jgi:hypothetical protein